MHFGFAIDLSDIDLWDIDYLDRDLDLLDTNTPLNTLFVSKTSSRGLQDVSSRRLEDVFNLTIFHLPTRLEDVLKSSDEIFSGRLQDVLEDKKLLRWRRGKDICKTCLEDVLKTNKCFLGRTTLFWSLNFKWWLKTKSRKGDCYNKIGKPNRCKINITVYWVSQLLSKNHP